MRKARRWPAFLVIATLVATAVLASSAAALAAEAQATSGETGGVIEALVWDDYKSPDGKYTDADLVDGIKVNLYYLKNKEWVTSLDPTVENFEGPDPSEYLFYIDSTNMWGAPVRDYWNGEWVLVGTKVTGPGGYAFGQENTIIEYQHGWVGWNNLPLDSWGDNTFYKLELVDNGTFKPLDGGERIAQLNPWNLHTKQYLPLTFDTTPPFSIQSTSAYIGGTVWSDANADQQRQWAEKPLEGCTVVLTNRYGSKVATATTNRYGYFYFQGLKPDTYKVWVMSKRNFKQVKPYYKLLTWPPSGCEKGHYCISAARGKYYDNNDFGLLDMKDSVWAKLYYGLWWLGLLQYQFTW